nr:MULTISPECIES: MFS transporter [unclassified Frankia]
MVDISTGAGPAAGPRRALTALCVTTIVSYGVLYYAFPVLAEGIAADTGWSRTAVTAAFSAGNLLGAVAGVPVGRVLGRRGPRPVMTAGSVLAVAALAGVAEAPSYGWFLAAWLVAGVAMAGVFYPPAFAALTSWYGPHRVRALTTLTLAAGFASTISRRRLRQRSSSARSSPPDCRSVSSSGASRPAPSPQSRSSGPHPPARPRIAETAAGRKRSLPGRWRERSPGARR